MSEKIMEEIFIINKLIEYNIFGIASENKKSLQWIVLEGTLRLLTTAQLDQNSYKRDVRTKLEELNGECDHF